MKLYLTNMGRKKLKPVEVGADVQVPVTDGLLSKVTEIKEMF